MTATVEPDLFTGETPSASASKVWDAVCKDLIYAVGANVHRSWTGRLRITGADAYAVTLTAPTRFIATKIETSHADVIKRLWKKHERVDPPRRIVIAKPEATQAQKPVSAPVKPAVQKPVTASVRTLPVTHERAGTRFAFDAFIVGPSNEFAFAVARQVAHADSAQYNPIVIHGENGMGKTHLLYAVRNAVQARADGRSVRLITGEEFVGAFVKAVKSEGREAIDAFKADLRGVDVLIIDDAHFIAGKRESRMELLHTLVSLVDDGRQVLIACDRHPDKLENAPERLKSYLNSGLVCKIGPADYALRIRMLDRLIARRRENGSPTLSVPQNARDHLAARINATPRDLEGAFNQVVARSEFLGTPITLDTVREALSESRYAAGQRLTVDKIQRAVAEEFGLSLDDMVSKRRARAIARPRQAAMFLCKKMTRRSLPDIGRRFGGRDHTTVMHAVKRITELCETDPVFAERVKAVENRLRG